MEEFFDNSPISNWIIRKNGSGKSTFIKIAAGIIRQTEGEILIKGHKPGTFTKSIVSYLPDVNPLYKWMKVKDSVNTYSSYILLYFLGLVLLFIRKKY